MNPLGLLWNPLFLRTSIPCIWRIPRTFLPAWTPWLRGPCSPQLERLEGAPRGEIIEHKAWAGSAVYPGTTRDWYVYVPAQYDPATPAALWVGI